MRPVAGRAGAGEKVAKAPGAFQRLGHACNAARSEHRRHDAVLCGEAGVHRFRHGAELELRAARHAERQAQGCGHACLIQPQQARAGGGRAEGPERGSRMPAPLVVLQIDAVADQRERLQADDISVQNRSAGCALRLGQRENRGRKHRCRVARHRVVVVVVVERMRSGAEDERRSRRSPAAR